MERESSHCGKVFCILPALRTRSGSMNGLRNWNRYSAPASFFCSGLFTQKDSKNFSLGLLKICKCLIYETVAVTTQRFKKKKTNNRFDIGTWPSRFLSQLSQVKQSYRHEKFRQSRPDKPQPWGLTNSVQSLWPVTSNDNILQGPGITISGTKLY